MFVFLIIFLFAITPQQPMIQSNSHESFDTQGRQTLQTNFSAYHDEVKEFVERYNLPGAQLAIAYNGTIVFDQSYGVEDYGNQKLVTSDSRFRIASLSKAITAAAIQTLVVRGNISLDDQVVNLIPDLLPGLLNGCTYPQHPNQWSIQDINVSHLLNHSSGLVTNLTSWHYAYDWVDTDTEPAPVLTEGANNPCIDHVTVSQQYNNGTTAPVEVETMIRETLRLPLNSQPGTQNDYSNIGYRILGEIIERQCNCSYEEYVKTYVLRRMNIHNMQVGKTLIEDKAENEVTYYHALNNTYSFSWFPQLGGNIGDNTEVNPLVNVSFGNSTSSQSHRAYGGSASVMEELEASGGWISNAASYARFLTYYDGTIPHPYFNNSFDFATSSDGWGRGAFSDTNNASNFRHTGSLSATATRYARNLVDNNSLNIVFLTNTNPAHFNESVSENWSDDRKSLMENASLKIDFANLECDIDGMMDGSCSWDPVACEWVCVETDWQEDPNLQHEEPVERIQLIMPNETIILTKGIAMRPITGETRGDIIEWSISPALPRGLQISATNGTISGTPTVTSPLTDYLVTVSNRNGDTASDILSLIVETDETSEEIGNNTPSISMFATIFIVGLAAFSSRRRDE